MRLFLQVLFVLSLGSIASAYWRHMLTTFGPIPGLGNAFAAQPRTLAELTDDGWVQISSCADSNPNFPGDRFVRSQDDKDMVILLDGNGYIAGIQSVVMKEYVLDEQAFSNPYYVLGDWFGEEAYFVTAYFVDTAIICNGGRTQEEFENEGTGYRVAFQNGPTNVDLQEIPLTKDEMLNDDGWFEHYCFINMGEHFFNFPPSAGDDYNCNDVIPYQTIYWRGALTGFVFQHQANPQSDRYEEVTPAAIAAIVNDAPQCLVDKSEMGIIYTMHVWLDDYLISCLG